MSLIFGVLVHGDLLRKFCGGDEIRFLVSQSAFEGRMAFAFVEHPFIGMFPQNQVTCIQDCNPSDTFPPLIMDPEGGASNLRLQHLVT